MLFLSFWPGFLRIRRVLVPFTSQRTGSTQLESESLKSSNQNPCASFQTVQMDQALPSLPHPSQPSQPSHSNQATTRFAFNNVASSHPNQSKPSSSDLQSSLSSSPSVQAQYHEVMSKKTKNAYSPSSNCVPYFPQAAPKTHMNSSPSVYSQICLPLTNRTESQIKNISESANCRKAYCPTMQVSHTRILTHPMPIPGNNQTPVITHPIPANNQSLIPTRPVPANNQTPLLTRQIPVNNQTPIKINPVPANNQTLAPSHPIPANNQTLAQTHPIPANNQMLIPTSPVPANIQTPVITYPMPVINQTPLLTHQIPVNNQTPIKINPVPANNQTLAPSHPIPANKQTHAPSHPIPANNQIHVLIQPIPVNNQTPVLIHPIPTNNQSTILTHSIPTYNQTLILTHPVQTNLLGPGHSFSVQPNIPLTFLSTINTLSLNDATAISNVLPVNQMPSTPIDGNDTLWCRRGTYISTDLPVKALADSACDQDAGVSSTNFTDTDHLESNLPTFIVSEAAPKEPSPDPGHSSGPSNIHQDSLSTSTTTEKCSSQAQDFQSSNKNYSRPKHWSIGMPATFRQLVEATCIPVRSKDNLSTTPPADSAPCSTSEDLDGEVGESLISIDWGMENCVSDLCFIQKLSFPTRGQLMTRLSKVLLITWRQKKKTKNLQVIYFSNVFSKE